MNTLVPNRFLFSFEFPLAYRREAPSLDGTLSSWSDAERLPALGDLDGRPEFAAVWACWNEAGLSIACRVSNKKKPLHCDPRTYWKGDNLRLCVDTRDARNVRRATRFCRQFYFLPTGRPGRDGPAAGVGRANREDAPPVLAEPIRVASHVTRTSYNLEAQVPATCLPGFDPLEHPRIGFYYLLEDGDHGQQYLTVGDDLLWHIDPSTWATAVLRR